MGYHRDYGHWACLARGAREVVPTQEVTTTHERESFERLRKLTLYPTELRTCGSLEVLFARLHHKASGTGRLGMVGARGFEPPTSCSQSQLGNDTVRHAVTQHATIAEQHHRATGTARYRPQQQDTDGTVTKTGTYGWNRDGNRDAQQPWGEGQASIQSALKLRDRRENFSHDIVRPVRFKKIPQ